MPEFYKGRKMRVRRAASGGKEIAEITIPKILIENNVFRIGEKLTPVFDSVLLYLPEGKTVDFKKLKEAIKDVCEEREEERERGGGAV